MLKKIRLLSLALALTLATALCLAACSPRDGQDSRARQGDSFSESSSPEASASPPEMPEESDVPEEEPAPDPLSDAELHREILLVFGGEIATDQEGDPYLSAKKAVSLYYSEGWADPRELTPRICFSWFYSRIGDLIPYEERLELFRSPFGEGTGWFYPQDIFEELVQQYFDVSTELLRSDDAYYHAEHEGYWVDGGPGIGDTPAILLDDVVQEGDLLHLHITLRPSASPEEQKILTARLLPEGGYHFESYRTA